jgi:NADH-quinone oxidoreductase subunit J
MVLQNNPVRSALFLVLNLFCVAVLYLLLNAWFLATIQVLVYAGAIMVLFLFVIMLLNLRVAGPGRGSAQAAAADRRSRGLVLALLIGGMVLSPVQNPQVVRTPEELRAIEHMGTVSGVGLNLYDPNQPWLFPFEVTSVLLLIAVIGSVVLAKRRL